ncbi:hypothetical protein SDC9_175821 [bioreactor metagenome]|uniref:Uncharacterized protein n=1 Tax=bioreactor metagenome TaxID=1076179 RepID=A0A645GQ75_9ZZZZ
MKSPLSFIYGYLLQHIGPFHDVLCKYGWELSRKAYSIAVEEFDSIKGMFYLLHFDDNIVENSI